jgi:hypothetical protein
MGPADILWEQKWWLFLEYTFFLPSCRLNTLSHRLNLQTSLSQLSSFREISGHSLPYLLAALRHHGSCRHFVGAEVMALSWVYFLSSCHVDWTHSAIDWACKLHLANCLPSERFLAIPCPTSWLQKAQKTMVLTIGHYLLSPRSSTLEKWD